MQIIIKKNTHIFLKGLSYYRNFSSLMSSISNYKFESLLVTSPFEYVYHVQINRPEKRNAMNLIFWKEMITCFNNISDDSNCRVVVVSGLGKVFTAGIDINSFSKDLMNLSDLDVGRKSFALRKIITSMQETFTVIEKCYKPVISAIHSACIGAGVDMISACDIRYATQDAYFQIKEVDLGLAADVGTLQRFSKIVGNDSLVRELCYTARSMFSDEALKMGLLSRIFPDYKSLIEGSLELARLISTKSPIAVQSSKLALVYARDHSVHDSLNQMAFLNQSMLQSEDLIKAVMGSVNKEIPIFEKL